MTKRSTWALPYAIFLVLFVALPLILIMFYAFRDGAGQFTLGNFIKFFTDKDAIETFALSLEVAIENTAFCILLGYPAAWILANRKLNRSAVTIYSVRLRTTPRGWIIGATSRHIARLRIGTARMLTRTTNLSKIKVIAQRCRPITAIRC